MATDVEQLGSLIGLHRRSASLSQGVVAGVVALFDGLSVVVATLLVSLARVVMQDEPFFPPVGVVLLAAVLVLLTYHAGGLYRFTAIMRSRTCARRAALLATGVALVLLGLGDTLKVAVDFSLGWLLGWLVCSIAVLLSIRFVVATSLRKLAKAGRIGRRIIIYGAGLQGERLIKRIHALDEPWNQVVGVFDDRKTRVGAFVAGHPVAGSLADLLNWCQRDRPDEILIALPWSAEDRILSVLRQFAVLPSNVRLAPEFQRMDMIEGRTNSQFGLPMLTAYQKPIEGWGQIWKRGVDFVLACAATLPVTPLLLLIAVLIRLESPGPILFVQPRFGFNNKLINVYKFRSMRSDASDKMGDVLTQRGDSRVTRIGAILRSTSLDELPQLLNVMRGEMSLVGPRPHAIRTTAGGRQCDAVVDQYAVRHKVKPGITGWAQVNGWRGTMETEEHLVKRLEHDLYYINNWSPYFDVKILVLTVWAVLNRRNSY